MEEARQEKRRVDRMKYIRSRVAELRKESQVDKEAEPGRKATEEKAQSVKLMSL